MSTPDADLHEVERSLLDRIDRLVAVPERSEAVAPMTAATLVEAQITSRLLDHTARWLRVAHDLGHYTIGSAGHEANAAVALCLRPSDPALLHYRSGGFYVARSLQARQQGIGTSDPIDDVLRGMLARATEPIAGGRHKVFGQRDLAIIPQTSTIASHLPRAVGLASSFDHVATGVLDPDQMVPTWPLDSVVICSFGDGSLNHSTAQGALNWAAQLTHAGRRVPVVFLCEDNGLGLSVPTAPGWVEAAVSTRPGLDYLDIDGTQPATAIPQIRDAIERVRHDGRPAFVHLDTVRFLGHAGTDVETAYRSPESIRDDLDRDPIIGAAQLAVDAGTCAPSELVEWYLDLRGVIRTRALEIAQEPPLVDAADVMRPFTPQAPQHRHGTIGAVADRNARATLAQTINATLADVLTDRPEAIVFGEDVGRRGGVYGVTRGLQKRFGTRRVFDTVLDEQSVLGLALGSSLNGFLPIPEIQYLAYLHNAEDQLRGEAATLAFFSNRQFLNPMVVRVAAYAYQRGFGGHFHNDNSIAVLRDIPGIVIASPSHPSDAGPMLRTCIDHAASTGAVCVFLEPIARYHTNDLHEPDDVGWTTRPGENVEPTGARTHGDGTDLTIVTWANGAYLSRRAASRLATEHGIAARVVDVRWLAPLPLDQLVVEATATGRVLVVDETRRTGGVGEGIVAELVGVGFQGRIARIAGHDSFIPLGDAAQHVLVAEDDIVAATLRLLE